MAKRKLSEEQKLRNKIIQNVNSRSNFLNRERYRDIKSTFIEKYVLTEITVKNVLSSYYKNKGESKDVESIDMGMLTIGAALKQAGYTFDDDILIRMSNRYHQANSNFW